MRKARWTLWLVAGLIYAFLYAPLVVIVLYSFNSAKHGGPWSGFTIHWYAQLFSNSDKLEALRNTLFVALTSTAVSTVLGTSLGYGLSRYRPPGGRMLIGLIYLPIVVPDIVMGIGLLMFYSFVHQWLGLLQLGLATMILAHISFQIPFVALVVRARLSGIDPTLEEAARDLGASPWQTFRHVTLPLITPGVLAGTTLAFTSSIDDFVVSYFTTGPGAATLPILIYASVKRGVTPDINALSTLVLAASIAGTITVSALQGLGGRTSKLR